MVTNRVIVERTVPNRSYELLVQHSQAILELREKATLQEGLGWREGLIEMSISENVMEDTLTLKVWMDMTK